MAKHHDTTDVVLSDTRPAKQAISMLLRDGKWEEALGVARTVSLPTRTLLNVDIARHIFYTSTDSSAATILLDQLVAARCYDVSLVGDILALSWPIIGQTPRPPIAGLQAPNERDS